MTPSPDTPMRATAHPTGTSWCTVGLKLLLGVALASNCCIGALLAVNHRAAATIDQMVSEVLTIHEQLESNLRQTIVQLQQEFVALPRHFVPDPRKAILERLERDFSIRERQRLAGRDSYGPLFSRGEKRDLANGRVVIKVDGDGLLLAQGLADAQGAFTTEVEVLRLASGQPDLDLERLRGLVDAVQAETSNGAGFAEQLARLRSVAADKSIEAEKSRTEILAHVDQINHHEQRMSETGNQQRRLTLTVGAAAMVINVLVLFVLTRIIVEQPLHRLTGIVEDLGKGGSPDIPWLDRRDQIGVLSAAIGRFRDVLCALKREEERKDADRGRIEALVTSMTGTIQDLDQHTARLTHMSLSLQELAGITERESGNVAQLAGDTARRTEEVGASSRQISAMAGEIHRELGVQQMAVGQMAAEIGRARQQLTDLSQSVAEIDTIVGAVHAITDQTKILAINAAIEAVKAGEHGRGFAVVADEVKTLSQHTAHATRDVLAKIEAINGTCRCFIDSFNHLDQGAAQLHQVTATIGQAVAQQRQLTGAIVDLTAATGANTREVSTRIAEVNDAAAGVLHHSIETNRCAGDIALQLGTLLSGSVRSLDALSGNEATAAVQDSSETHPAPTHARQWAEVDVRRPAAGSVPAIGAQAGSTRPRGVGCRPQRTVCS